MPAPADALPADMLPADMLIGLLRAPQGLVALAPADWYPLLLAARDGGLIGALAARAEADGVLDRLPAPARDALVGGRRVGDHHDFMLRWEARRVRRALADCGQPFLLLKGAAYALLDLPSSRGRLTGDIDILVRREGLPAVEASLQAHGWQPTEADAYDQRYYRQYMHELPPLRHRERGTVVDVHHTISPPTSRIKIDGGRLWSMAQPIGDTGFFTLAPTDLVLHAVIHLFHEGNVDTGIRDLADIDALLRHFGRDETFWESLLRRADSLGAGRVAFYGLRYAAMLFGTPVPPATLAATARWRPASPMLKLMDGLIVEALLSYRRREAVKARVANWMLYIRSHWRRMPPLMLAAHLLRKLFRRSAAA
jgi:hypothetical protein